MFQPQPVTAPMATPDGQAVVTWTMRELTRVGQEIEGDRSSLRLTPLYAAPPRIYPGMTVLADGVTWKPDGVNGEGYYRRNLANTTWKYLG